MREPSPTSQPAPTKQPPSLWPAPIPPYAREPQYHDLLRCLPSLARYHKLIAAQLVDRRLADKSFAPGQSLSDREEWAQRLVKQVLDDLATLEVVK